jgi:pathogenesis-related protein 1
MAIVLMAMSVASLAARLTTAALGQSLPEDYVRLHNTARSAAGVGPVAWDDALAQEAGKSADHCELPSRDGHHRHRHRYGENLFHGPPEKACDAGDALGAWTAPAAREYVQVVWPGSTKIGCARSICHDNRGVFISCNYEPAGNDNTYADTTSSDFIYKTRTQFKINFNH